MMIHTRFQIYCESAFAQKPFLIILVQLCWDSICCESRRSNRVSKPRARVIKATVIPLLNCAIRSWI
jgi:hypothetical protein